MNNRQNGRRRGRGGQQARNGQPGGPDRGNRLDNRARGNAAQLLEKYKNLARDAQMQGDRVNTEYYLQFADHYFRVLNENRARFEEQRPRQQGDYRDDFGGDEDGGDAQQQRYQGHDDQGDDGWDDGEQPQAEDASRARPRNVSRAANARPIAARMKASVSRAERPRTPERRARERRTRSVKHRATRRERNRAPATAMATATAMPMGTAMALPRRTS